MQTHCSRCNATLKCGVEEKSCWCQSLPSLPAAALVDTQGCLCPQCLSQQLHSGVLMYAIPNCDTVKKARTWLDTQGIAYAFWDYKKYGVPSTELADWVHQKSWQVIANTRGPSWRKLMGELNLTSPNNDNVIQALLAYPSAIKRPIMTWGQQYQNKMTVGFDAVQWEELIRINI